MSSEKQEVSPLSPELDKKMPSMDSQEVLCQEKNVIATDVSKNGNNVKDYFELESEG
jgi:hypothetical protein